VRIPFAERIKESWIKSWQNQKRDQTDYVLHFVRLHTEEGVSGIGEAKMSRPQAEAKLAGMMGRSPWDYLLDDSLQGILIAVYDLLGKASNQPVARLFAGDPRKSITPTWWSQCFEPDVMASEARLAVKLGYKVHKVKARPWQDAIKQAEAMCAAVPKDFKIWVDANGTWETAARTLDLAKQLSRFPNYIGVETPVPRGALEEYRRLKGKMPLPVAEHVDGLDVEQWTREGLLDAWIVGAPEVGEPH